MVIVKKLIEWICHILWKNSQKEAKLLVSYDDLVKINGGLNKDMCKYYLDALNKVLPEYKIDTRLRICHFLAQYETFW